MVTPLVSRDFAEDVVQETWIKAFAAAGGFEGRSSLRTWLAQIALNTARSWRRARRLEPGERWGGDPGSPLAGRFTRRRYLEQLKLTVRTLRGAGRAHLPVEAKKVLDAVDRVKHDPHP